MILSHPVEFIVYLFTIFVGCIALIQTIFRKRDHQNPSIRAVRLIFLCAGGAVIFGSLGELYLLCLHLSPYPRHIVDSLSKTLRDMGLGALVTLVVLKLVK